MVFLYLPRTKLPHRLGIMALCALAGCAFFAVGLALAGTELLAVLGTGLVAMLATVLCRLLQRSPPGSLFLTMPAAIAAFAPAGQGGGAERLGAYASGCLFALLMALIYSMHIKSRHPRRPITPLAEPRALIASDAIVLGVTVALACLAAMALDLARPYWVAVSAVTIMQGTTLQVAWQRKVHRIAGTLAGLLLAWPLLQWIGEPTHAALAIVLLLFVVETLVVRHYAAAVMFITPMAILLAETAHLQPGQHAVATGAILQARLIDTMLGAALGLAGVLAQRMIARRLNLTPAG